MKIGILGAGGIAAKMADTVGQMKDVQICAVASRDLEKAEKFAEKYGVSRAYGSYEELVQDKEVELVYIATVHSCHYEQARLCLLNGKNVLCEKAFMINQMQAKEIFELAAEKKLFITEAIWTRYMPSRKIINEILERKEIGEPSSLTANLGYIVCEKERMKKSSLGGGALLDLGVYPINFALMAFGEDYTEVSADAVFNEDGVDEINSITLKWKDGKVAVLHSNMKASTDRKGIIYGDKGYLVVENINNCERIDVYDNQRNFVCHYDVPAQITGYEYEVEACREALQKGEFECPQMPHETSLHVMRLLDKIRSIWGMKYACEE